MSGWQTKSNDTSNIVVNNDHKNQVNSKGGSITFVSQFSDRSQNENFLIKDDQIYKQQNFITDGVKNQGDQSTGTKSRQNSNDRSFKVCINEKTSDSKFKFGRKSVKKSPRIQLKLDYADKSLKKNQNYYLLLESNKANNNEDSALKLEMLRSNYEKLRIIGDHGPNSIGRDKDPNKKTSDETRWSKKLNMRRINIGFDSSYECDDQCPTEYKRYLNKKNTSVGGICKGSSIINKANKKNADIINFETYIGKFNMKKKWTDTKCKILTPINALKLEGPEATKKKKMSDRYQFRKYVEYNTVKNKIL